MLLLAGVERKVPLAGSKPLREALGATRNDVRSSIKLWNGRNGGGKSQESNGNLHHGDCRFKLALVV